MSRDLDCIVGISGLAIGLIGIGYALGVHSKMKEVSDKLDRSIDDLVKNEKIDIPRDMVEQAVERAVNREAAYAITRATDRITDKAKTEISKKVSAEVESQKSQIADKVSAEVTKKVESIDGDALRRDIVKNAKERVAEKFDDKLDGLLDEFSGNLKNVSRIYESIAKSISRTDGGKEMIFKVA